MTEELNLLLDLQAALLLDMPCHLKVRHQPADPSKHKMMATALCVQYVP